MVRAKGAWDSEDALVVRQREAEAAPADDALVLRQRTVSEAAQDEVEKAVAVLEQQLGGDAAPSRCLGRLEQLVETMKARELDKLLEARQMPQFCASDSDG